MVEEHGVHGFTQVVVASECKGEVAHSSAHVCSRQMGANPLCGADEVEGIVGVFVHACCHGEYGGVEDDVERIEIELVNQEVVGSFADGDFALVGGGLPFFVECHDDDCCSEALYGLGMGKECGFSLLEGNGIDDALALYAFECRLDDFPLGGVDHDGHFRYVGVGHEEAQEMGHFRLCRE